MSRECVSCAMRRRLERVALLTLIEREGIAVLGDLSPHRALGLAKRAHIAASRDIPRRTR